jgi:serine/threonine protein kinase
MKTMLPIQHENIVRLYAAGKDGPHCWAAMEFVAGDSLADVIQEIGTAGMLDWQDAFRVAVHIGRALECATENKIIHRNVTPQNILRRAKDKVTKLGDLMLAKALEGSLAKQVTQPGQLIGDVPYMSPERTRQDPNTDGRSDIYELGATLYALLTGRPPFEENSLPVLIKKIREAEPEKPKTFHLAIPDRFQDVVMRMLAKRPDDRYRTASALIEELRRVGTYQRIDIDKI